MKPIIIILAIVLNLLGSLIFFFIKYKGREDKTKPFDPLFWWRDNRVEAFTILLVDALLMLLYLTGEININFMSLLPETIVPAGKGVLLSSAVIGLILAYIFYTAFSMKIKDAKKKIEE